MIGCAAAAALNDGAEARTGFCWCYLLCYGIAHLCSSCSCGFRTSRNCLIRARPRRRAWRKSAASPASDHETSALISPDVIQTLTSVNWIQPSHLLPATISWAIFNYNSVSMCSLGHRENKRQTFLIIEGCSAHLCVFAFALVPFHHASFIVRN